MLKFSLKHSQKMFVLASKKFKPVSLTHTEEDLLYTGVYEVLRFVAVVKPFLAESD